MWFFDKTMNGIFQKDLNGRPLLFPWGDLGKGYILKSEDQGRRFRKIYVGILTILSLTTLYISFFYRGERGLLYLFLTFCILFPINYFLTKDLEQVSEETKKLIFNQEHEKAKIRFSLWCLFGWLTFMTLVFGATTVLIVYASKNFFNGLILFPFFLLFFYLSWWFYTKKLKQK